MTVRICRTQRRNLNPPRGSGNPFPVYALEIPIIYVYCFPYYFQKLDIVEQIIWTVRICISSVNVVFIFCLLLLTFKIWRLIKSLNTIASIINPIFRQPDILHLKYFKLGIDIFSYKQNWKCQRFTSLRCKDTDQNILRKCSFLFGNLLHY